MAKIWSNRTCDLGTDSLDRFGGTYEGGWFLQLNPYETGYTIADLLELKNGYNRYLEIGTAAGGSLKLFTEALGIKEIVYIDDNQHAKCLDRVKTIKEIQESGVSVKEFIGNSHSIQANDFLANEKPFDLALIDGDHSEIGTRKDIELILPRMKTGGIVLLHDTATWNKHLIPEPSEGPEIIFNEVLDGKWPLEPIFHYVNSNSNKRQGFAGIRVLPLTAPRPIFGFWHVATLHNWKSIFLDQLNLLKNHGLLKETRKLYIGVLGDLNSVKELIASENVKDKIEIAYHSTKIEEYESPR